MTWSGEGFEIVGVDRIVFDQSQLMELMQSSEVMAGLATWGVQVQSVARRLCPVLTGRLRSSISMRTGVDTEGPFVEVGTDVEYAPHVEFGTVRMRAQPFLRPALEQVRRDRRL